MALTYINIFSPTAFDSDPAYWTLTASVLADMDANDTCQIKFTVPNSGAAQVDVAADSFWSGYLAC